MLNVNTNLFHWSEIPKKDDTDIKKHIHNICNKKKLNRSYINKNKTITAETLLKEMLNLI